MGNDMRTMPETSKLYPQVAVPLDMSDLHLDDVLLQPYFYEQSLVKRIRRSGKLVIQENIDNVGEYHFLVGAFQASDYTIKIEGMERLSQKLWGVVNQLVSAGLDYKHPASCHCFIASGGSPSFPNHTDPDGVFIFVLEGTKSMVVTEDGVETSHNLKVGDGLWIPPGVVHRATNEEASVMLSIGFDKFHLEKLNA